MTEFVYYDDVKIIKKPLKERVKRVFKFFLIIITIGACFLSARYLSSALTVGNISSLIVYGGTNIKINEKKYYAVTLGNYESYDEAERVALGSTIQGASGFVWEKGNKFYVVGNIYSNQDDAKAVIDNLIGTKYTTEIIEIQFDKLKLNFDMYDNSAMPIINNALEVFDNIYDDIYDLSVKFDKGEISHLAVSSETSKMRGCLKGIIVNVQNLINKKDSKLQIVQQYLVGVDEVLDQAILKTIDNTATGYSLKNAIACVLRLKYDMYKNLV